MKIFSYDSKFSQIMLKISAACYLNILWFFCSIPIFTMGAATAALYDVTIKIARDEEPRLAPRFFVAFKRNFKQATVIWMILLVIGLVMGTDLYVLYHLYKTTNGTVSVMWTLMFALVIVASIVYFIILMYVFPLISHVQNTNLAMVKNSLLIGIHYLFCTLLMFALHFAMFFAVVAIFTPLVIFGEGLVALLSSYLLSNVLYRVSYDPNAEELPAEELPEEE